ncbi:hypothetical protein DRQ36_00740 [bacterium]|nr:MAG: hypothetical protein DRQ36_00740 [bacterium]
MNFETLHIVTAFPRSEQEVTITPWLVETLRRLKDRRIGVTVLAPSYKGLGDQTLWGIPVKRFRYFPKRWEDLTHDVATPVKLQQKPHYVIQSGMLVLRSISAAKKLALEIRPDIIHVHWPFPFAIPGAAAAKISRAKLVLKFYSAELVFLKKRAGFLSNLIRKPINKADLILANSSYTAALFNQFYPGREIEVLPEGYFVPESIDENEGLSKSDPPEILFVGRFVERKGIDVLIRAFELVRKRIESRLVIVGGGPMENELRRLVSELGLDGSVEFAIRLPEDELDSRYRKASVFVLPAIYDRYGDTEGLGMVLIEALARRTPVVASRAGGIVDIVRDNQTGLLAEPGNPDELAVKIIEILSDSDKARNLAETGFEYVRKQFDWDNVIEKLVLKYKRILENSTR